MPFTFDNCLVRNETSIPVNCLSYDDRYEGIRENCLVQNPIEVRTNCLESGRPTNNNCLKNNYGQTHNNCIVYKKANRINCIEGHKKLLKTNCLFDVVKPIVKTNCFDWKPSNKEECFVYVDKRTFNNDLLTKKIKFENDFIYHKELKKVNCVPPIKIEKRKVNCLPPIRLNTKKVMCIAGDNNWICEADLSKFSVNGCCGPAYKTYLICSCWENVEEIKDFTIAGCEFKSDLWESKSCKLVTQNSSIKGCYLNLDHRYELFACTEHFHLKEIEGCTFTSTTKILTDCDIPTANRSLLGCEIKPRTIGACNLETKRSITACPILNKTITPCDLDTPRTITCMGQVLLNCSCNGSLKLNGQLINCNQTLTLPVKNSQNQPINYVVSDPAGITTPTTNIYLNPDMMTTINATCIVLPPVLKTVNVNCVNCDEKTITVNCVNCEEKTINVNCNDC